MHEAGYRDVEAYSPLPVEGLAEAIGFRRTRMPLVVLVGGIVGCLAGWAMQYYTTVIAYPLNMGGRPTQQLAVVHSRDVRDDGPVRRAVGSARHAGDERLAAAASPAVRHPAIRSGHARIGFSFAFVARDPLFHSQSTREFLERLEAKEVIDVPL